MRSTRSPDSVSLWKVSMMGSPAPTVASCRIRRPRARAVCHSDSLADRRPAIGRLLASTRSMPWVSAGLQGGAGVVGGEIHQHRPGEGVPGDMRDRLLRRRRLAAWRGRRGGGPCACRRRARPAGGARSPGIEHEAAAVDHRRHLAARAPAGAPARSAPRACARSGRSPAAPRPCARAGSPRRRRSGRAGRRRGSGAGPPPPRRGSTTTEMFSSEEPWAMATTLMPPAASAEKTPAAMPGVPCMPRPTTAIVAMPGSPPRRRSRARAISPRNSRSRLLARLGGERLGDAEADRVLRRGLGDQRDGDPRWRAARRRCARRCRARRACRSR